MRDVFAQVPVGMTAGRLSLDPLKRHGQAALDCSDIPGLLKVVLRDVHQFRRSHRCIPLVYIADDVFHSRRFDDQAELFPLDCTITEAVFDFYFADSPIPRSVTIEPTCTFEPERLTDAEIIQRWASLRGFLVPLESQSDPDEQAMAIA